MQMRTASPFVNTGSYAHWTNQGVSIWFWDEDRVSAALLDKNIPKSTPIYPETALSQPMSSGMRLVHCLEGFEGQIWDQHQLLTSRWWDHHPNEEEWLQFWRSASQTAHSYAQEIPKHAKETILLPKSWAHSRPIAGGFTLESLYSREALAVLTLILALPISFYGGQILNDYLSLGDIQQRIIAMEPETKKIEIERKSAEANISKIKKILDLDPYPNPVTLLAKIIQKIETPGLKVIDFRFNRDTINITLLGETQPDPASFVALMETIPDFDQVNTDPGFTKNTLRVTLKVKKLWS
jgi:hypothetical protein